MKQNSLYRDFAPKIGGNSLRNNINKGETCNSIEPKCCVIVTQHTIKDCTSTGLWFLASLLPKRETCAD